MSDTGGRFPQRLHQVDQPCERRGCEKRGPLTDIAATPMKPAEWRVETPGTDLTDGVLVCETCAAEFSEQMSVAGGITPVEFVAEPVDQSDV